MNSSSIAIPFSFSSLRTFIATLIFSKDCAKFVSSELSKEFFSCSNAFLSLFPTPVSGTKLLAGTGHKLTRNLRTGRHDVINKRLQNLLKKYTVEDIKRIVKYNCGCLKK
jgi:hypothetical protein